MTGIDTDNQNAARLLPVPEAAQALGVSERTVWRRIRSGKLPTTDIGGKTCVQLTALTPGTDTDNTAVSMTGKAPDTAAPLLIEVLQGTISQLRTDNERLWRKLDEQAQQISDLTKIMLPPPGAAPQVPDPAKAKKEWITFFLIAAAILLIGAAAIIYINKMPMPPRWKGENTIYRTQAADVETPYRYHTLHVL